MKIWRILAAAVFLPLVLPVPLQAGIHDAGGTAARTEYLEQNSSEREYFRYRSYRLQMPDKRWSIRISAGMPSALAPGNFTGNNSEKYIKGEMISYYYNNYCGKAYDSGCYGLGAEYYLARWFAVSADLCFEGLWMDLYDRHSGMKTRRDSGLAIAFVPQAKFIYIHRPLVRVYSGIGIGAAGYIGFDSKRRSYIDEDGPHYSYDKAVRLTLQFTPIGVEVGRRFFGFAEIGTGSLFSGMRAGAGFKF